MTVVLSGSAPSVLKPLPAKALQVLRDRVFHGIFTSMVINDFSHANAQTMMIDTHVAQKNALAVKSPSDL
jgi:hypothetical protein